MSQILKKHPSWVLTAQENDMDANVNCANCGKSMKFGEGYTSKQHFTDNGFWGLCECEECYFKNIND